MTYTILLNGGREISVDHPATPQQMEAVIKGFQGSAQWVKFITPDGDWYLDSLAIQGFKPHDSLVVTFGEATEQPPMASVTGQPPTGRPAKKKA